MLEIKAVWAVVLGAVVSICGLMGWSHKSLRDRVDKLTEELAKKTTDTQVRSIVQDHLKVQEVRNADMCRRMDEIKKSQAKVYEKLDKLYELCLYLKGDK